nr:peptide transporter [Planctomycetota bacterium]
MARVDKELEQYRQLMTVPNVFENGFSLSTFFGVMFIALVMVPGSLYMELLAGQGIGSSAQWVTVILFMEIAKRANAKLSRAQLFVLFYLSGTIIGQGGGLLWTQFLVRSDAALGAGLSGAFPIWVAPSDPAAYENRTFFQAAWLPAIGLIFFRMFFGRLDNMVLGYGLFRLTSDIEKLPFPLAPVGAQGMLALSDDLEWKAQVQG